MVRDALAADLVHQVRVEAFNREHGDWRRRTRTVDLVRGLPDQRQAVTVELKREAFVDGAHRVADRMLHRAKPRSWLA